MEKIRKPAQLFQPWDPDGVGQSERNTLPPASHPDCVGCATRHVAIHQSATRRGEPGMARLVAWAGIAGSAGSPRAASASIFDCSLTPPTGGPASSGMAHTSNNTSRHCRATDCCRTVTGTGARRFLLRGSWSVPPFRAPTFKIIARVFSSFSFI